MNRPIHLIYAANFLFLVATRYLIYFSPDSGPTSAPLGQVFGANLSYLVIWGLGYWLCLKAMPPKGTYILLGTLAVLVGPLVAPLFSYAILIFMYLKLRRQDTSGTGASTPNDAVVGQRFSWPRFTLDPRTPIGLLSLVFWLLFAAYLISHRQEFAVAMAAVLVLNVTARFSFHHRHIYHSRLLSWLTWGKERQVNEWFALQLKLPKMSAEQLNRLLLRRNPLLRQAVLLELADKGNAATIQTLTTLLDNGATESPEMLAEALANLSGVADQEKLLSLLAHADFDARRHGAAGLYRLDLRETLPQILSGMPEEPLFEPARDAIYLKVFLAWGNGDILNSWWPRLGEVQRREILLGLTKWPVAEEMECQLMALGSADPNFSPLIGSLHRGLARKRTEELFPQLCNEPSAPSHIVRDSQHLPTAPLPKILAETAGREVCDLSLTVTLLGGNEAEAESSTALSMVLEPLEGATWRFEARFCISDFFADCPAEIGHIDGCYFVNLPPSTLELFEKCLLLCNGQAFDDGRYYCLFQIGPDHFPVRMKYANYYTDLALDKNGPEGPVLLARFQGLVDDDGNDIPPFVLSRGLLPFLCQKRETWWFDGESHHRWQGPQITEATPPLDPLIGDKD